MEDLQEKFKEAWQKIKIAKNILVVSHHNPDADALASLSIFMELLENEKKNYLTFAEDKPETIVAFIPREEKIFSNLPADFKLTDFDLLLALDCGSLKRTGLEEEIKAVREEGYKGLYIIEIDHHPRVDDYADLEIRFTKPASTTEILYDFLKVNEIKFNKNLATAILAGILSDTGNFLYPTTSDKTIQIASEMLEYGAQFPKVLQNTSQNKNVGDMRLWGRALRSLKINKKYNLAISFLSLDDVKGISDSPNNDIFGDIAGSLSNLSDISAVALFREEEEGRYKISLRTARHGVDLSRLARVFGGGGHEKASGFSLSGKISRQNKGWRFEGV